MVKGDSSMLFSSIDLINRFYYGVELDDEEMEQLKDVLSEMKERVEEQIESRKKMVEYG